MPLTLIVALAAIGCSVSDPNPPPRTAPAVSSTTITTESTSTAPPTTAVVADSVLRVGAEVLADSDFALVEGARVGLIANQTSLVDGRHLIDELHEAAGVELVAVFAPEHGVRGTAGAGERIDDETDAATGVPILSLYGDTRRPTVEMFEGIDTIVYDLQDVGGRFYTYISTMGLAMQTANEVGARFVVLDRPDPSGLTTATGFVLEAEHRSFIGQYPIPAGYAMTPGELARAVVGEGWIDGVAGLDLEVVEMQGWRRGMSWEETGREWIPPSPGLQTARSAVVYLGTVLFEATSISYGGGTDLAFELVGAPWADADLMALELNARSLPGARFDPITFTPRPIAGRTTDPRLNGEIVHGVQIVIEDRATFDPVVVAVHVLDAFWREARVRDVPDEAYIDRPATFTLLAGTTRLLDGLTAGATATEVVDGWATELAAFARVRSAYLLY